jgi:hypothetical protein
MQHGRLLTRVTLLALISATVLILLFTVHTMLAPITLSDGQRQMFPPANALLTEWNSGWVSITPGPPCSVFTHNLGLPPERYAVELLFRDEDSLGVNLHGYGGLDVNGQQRGAHWQDLTPNTIKVCRGADDQAADQIRVRVGIPPSVPDYESAWTDIAPGQTITFTHSLAITATELTVSMWFSDASYGIHQLGYGGLAIDDLEELRGAHWHNLATNTIQVTRHPTDPFVSQVRVLIVHGTSPDYDSLDDPGIGDWQSIAPGQKLTFTHNLNAPPEFLLSRLECYSSTIADAGIHQWFAGGNHDWFVGFQGVNLQNLEESTVVVYRQADDQVCPQVRVRIWNRARQTFLPLVLDVP